MQSLPMECTKCKVAETCPKKGSSPLILNSGKRLLCQVYGYGRTPIEKAKLGPESLARSERDGPCLTIAELPVLDSDSGMVITEVLKIFNHPILHEREKTTFHQDMVYPKSHRS
jgi:hypothetical protein